MISSVDTPLLSRVVPGGDPGRKCLHHRNVASARVPAIDRASVKGDDELSAEARVHPTLDVRDCAGADQYPNHGVTAAASPFFIFATRGGKGRAASSLL
jgi:hypothetical protein